MNIGDLLRSWKIMVPTSTATAGALLWILGVEIPKPVLADAYNKDIKELNVKQLDVRQEFLDEKLTRLRKEKLELEKEEWEIQRARQPMPPFLPELKAKTADEIYSVEQTMQAVHQQKIQLQK